MKIYSSFRRKERNSQKLWSWLGGKLAGVRRRGPVLLPRLSLKKLGFVLLCAGIVFGGLAVFNSSRFSFAYNPPLEDKLLVRGAALASFQSVPLTDPDEFEPDSMDRIDEVVEEVKPPASALTRRDLKFSKHKIRSGDSVWELSKKNGVRTGTLLWANSDIIRDPARLPLGKEIVIPNMDAIEVRVKRGETIWSLAKKFSVNAPEIAKFNNLATGAALKPGEKIYVPNPNFAIQAVVRAAREENPSGLIWPATYRIVNSEFGFRVHPVRKRRIFHEGIDIGGGRGSTVFAAGDGRVSFVGWMRGYGKIIVIRHQDGLTTRYAHLSSTRVTRGQRVEQGQLIGSIGATGLATGPNLHFEIRKNGLPQDPLTYLRKR